MAHVTNFVPKLPIFSSLSRMMSCPIFRPSNRLIGPDTHPYPSKYLPKHDFLSSPPSKQGGVSSLPHIGAKIVKKNPKKRRNAQIWRVLNVPERYLNISTHTG